MKEHLDTLGDRVVHVSQETYERLEQEAARRGAQLDALAAELLTIALARISEGSGAA